MPKAKKTKIKSVEEKQELGEILPLTVNSEKSGPMSNIHTHEGGDVPHTHEIEPEPVKEVQEMPPPEPEPVRSGPMTKEEWCAKNGIARPGSNSAEIQSAQYLAELA